MAKFKVRLVVGTQEFEEIIHASTSVEAERTAQIRNPEAQYISAIQYSDPIKPFPKTQKSNKVNQEDATLTIALVKGLFWLTWEGIKGLFKLSKFIISSIGKGIKGIYRFFKQND